jgi:hypothetical protein
MNLSPHKTLPYCAIALILWVFLLWLILLVGCDIR